MKFYRGAGMKKILKTFENNCMSLSCKGEIIIEDDIIKSINWHGYPRSGGTDNWVRYYKDLKVGDKIEQNIIDNILKYNGWSNIVSKIEEVQE